MTEERSPSLGIAAGLPADVGAAFDRRWQRVADCIALRTPDRMPVSLIAGFWFARYGGVSYRALMYDHETANAVRERALLEFEPDIGGGAGPSVAWGPLLDAIDFRQLEWPGHGVGDNSSYQYLDREYMHEAEYDEFIFDPTGFLFEKYLPRVAGAYDGLQPRAAITGSSYPLRIYVMCQGSHHDAAICTWRPLAIRSSAAVTDKVPCRGAGVRRAQLSGDRGRRLVGNRRAAASAICRGVRTGIRHVRGGDGAQAVGGNSR